MKKRELTPSQLKTITHLLEGNSVDAAAKMSKVSRSTVYNWLNQEHFKDRLDQERKALFEEGLNSLKGATAKAARTMIELLESKDTKTRRLAAKEIINFALKVAEVRELEERVAQLEALLEKDQYRH